MSVDGGGVTSVAVNIEEIISAVQQWVSTVVRYAYCTGPFEKSNLFRMVMPEGHTKGKEGMFRLVRVGLPPRGEGGRPELELGASPEAM